MGRKCRCVVLDSIITAPPSRAWLPCYMQWRLLVERESYRAFWTQQRHCVQTNRIRKIKSISVSGHAIITIYEHFAVASVSLSPPRMEGLPRVWWWASSRVDVLMAANMTTVWIECWDTRDLTVATVISLLLFPLLVYRQIHKRSMFGETQR